MDFFFFCITVLCFQVYFSVKDLYYEMVLLAPSLVFQRMKTNVFIYFCLGQWNHHGRLFRLQHLTPTKISFSAVTWMAFGDVVLDAAMV